MRYCPYCMREIEGSWCPDCQKDVETASNGTNLAIGTILDTHYVIGICLGAGGFGVTYLARDQHLGRIVAIKEYFPSCWAYRRKRTQEVCAFPDQQLAYERGKRQFLTEGQLLVEVEDLPHIVDVYDSFEENGTSYLVMRYLEGKTLEELVRSSEKGRLSLDELLPLMLPLMEDIDCLHRMTPPILHRDITPGNIMFSRGKLQLIDFGSARQILGDKSMSAMISMGFAPPEQFSRKTRGRIRMYTRWPRRFYTASPAKSRRMRPAGYSTMSCIFRENSRMLRRDRSARRRAPRCAMRWRSNTASAHRRWRSSSES